MIRQSAIVISACLSLYASPPAQADAEWDKLESAFGQAMEKWAESMDKAKGDGDAMMFNPDALPPHPIEEFRARFRAYAEKHAGKPEALPALTHLLEGGFSMTMTGKDESVLWALAKMTTDHAADPEIADHIKSVRYTVMSAGEAPVVKFLSAVAEKNPDPEIKGSARFAMAEVLYEGSPFARMMGGTSESAETKANKNRAISMLKEISAEFAGTEQADRADEFLFAIEHLQVGKKAPEIKGPGPDGKEIKSSQFKGKVVAVVFWATWCSPCMQMIPHERELMEKHAGKPFTLLGINADESMATMKRAIKKEKITWPTIFDGTPDQSKIAKKWRVQSFPTIYVIDHKGIIRHKELMPFQLENAVNELVAKAIEGGK